MLRVIILGFAATALACSATPPPTDGGFEPLPPPGPIAELTAVSPQGVLAGSPDTTVTLRGADFEAGAVVLLEGARYAPTTVSAGELTVSLPRALFEFAGALELRVVNPASTPSNGLLLTVFDPNPVPILVSASPDRATAGSGALMVTLTGARFVAGATAKVGGSDRASTRLDDTSLQLSLLASDLAAPATLSITVHNPAPGGGASNAVAFSVDNPAQPAGVLERVSIAVDGGDPSQECRDLDLSANGRFTVFYSDATNLVPNDTNSNRDVFRRDTCRGAGAGCVPSTEIVSLGDDGGLAMGGSQTPAISADGRFVAFVSNDGNLTATAATGSFNLYVRDTCQGASGCTPRTFLRNLDGSGAAVGVDSSHAVGLSDDGRFTLFASAAPYVAGDTNGALDYFVHDSCLSATGCTPTTVMASVSTAGTSGTGAPRAGRLSRNGRYVVFQSPAADLVLGDTNGQPDVFLRDTCLGAPAGCVPSTERVSLTSAGAQGRGTDPVIGADGRFIAFISEAALVAADTNNKGDVYLRDTCVGVASGCTPDTILVSVPLAQPASDWSYTVAPRSLSANGRYVALLSYANNLVTGDTNNKADLFVRDTCAGVASGCAPATHRVSISTSGGQINDTIWSGDQSWAISPDGRYAAFNTPDPSMVPGDGNNAYDVFLAGSGF